SCLRSLSKIAEDRGELQRAQELREEADRICPEPPADSPWDQRGQDLERLNCQGADWAGRRLQGAKLTNVDFSQAILALADLSGARLDTVALTGANLQDAQFRGADLHLVDFSGANLKDAQLQ